MKTQINDIKRGNQYVSGTSYAIREERGKAIIAENGDTMNITYKGVEIELKRNTSKSSKTTWYYTDLTNTQISALFPDDAMHNQNPTLVSYLFVITDECHATITRYRRKSLDATWKAGYEYRLNNNDIVIL